MTEPIYRITARNGDDDKPVLHQVGTSSGVGLYPLRFCWVWARNIATAKRIQWLYRQAR